MLKLIFLIRILQVFVPNLKELKEINHAENLNLPRCRIKKNLKTGFLLDYKLLHLCENYDFIDSWDFLKVIFESYHWNITKDK